jgi:putative chitinase
MNPGKIRFPTLADAEEVAKKGQEAIANVVYMIGRKLYDPQPGDGWKYRGRGLIQLTFKDGYLRASKDIYQDDRLVKDPDQVATNKQVAIDTAAWYFKRGNVNSWADKLDWGNCRSIVNAGSPGKDPTKIHGYTTAVKSSEDAYKIFKG